MSEQIDFNKKIDQSFHDETKKASKIFTVLEHLPNDEEFKYFIKDNLATKCQRVNLPKFLVRNCDMSEDLIESGILPDYSIIGKTRIALLQNQVEGDWQLSINFMTDSTRTMCLGDEQGFNVIKFNGSSETSIIHDTKIGHHLLHSILSVTDYDVKKFRLVDWEKDYYAPQISDHIIDLLSVDYKSETISTTNLVMCPDGHGLIASETGVTTKNSTATDVNINILKQLEPDNNGDVKTLAFEYKTFVNDRTFSPVTSMITWQLLKGEIGSIGKNFELAKILQANNKPEQINPVTNFEAWKSFMQLVDQILCYAMREA